MYRQSSITEFLGLQRSTVGVLFMIILVGMGERMAERFLPIYLMALGGGVLSIGILNGLDNLLSALYAFPGGYLSDRYGTKRALLFFNMVAMGGFVIVILIPAWQAVLCGAIFFLSWTAISLPATMSLIARVLPMNNVHRNRSGLWRNFISRTAVFWPVRARCRSRGLWRSAGRQVQVPRRNGRAQRSASRVAGASRSFRSMTPSPVSVFHSSGFKSALFRDACCRFHRPRRSG